MTIRARVVLTLTLSGLILFGVYSLYAYARERDHLERDAQSELALLTRSLRVAIENALRDQQIADVDETLTRLVELQPTMQVIVTGGAGCVGSAVCRPRDRTRQKHAPGGLPARP